MTKCKLFNDSALFNTWGNPLNINFSLHVDNGSEGAGIKH